MKDNKNFPSAKIYVSSGGISKTDVFQLKFNIVKHHMQCTGRINSGYWLHCQWSKWNKVLFLPVFVVRKMNSSHALWLTITPPHFSFWGNFNPINNAPIPYIFNTYPERYPDSRHTNFETAETIKSMQKKSEIASKWCCLFKAWVNNDFLAATWLQP